MAANNTPRLTVVEKGYVDVPFDFGPAVVVKGDEFDAPTPPTLPFGDVASADDDGRA